jgi:hypothetical protein
VRGISKDNAKIPHGQHQLQTGLSHVSVKKIASNVPAAAFMGRAVGFCGAPGVLPICAVFYNSEHAGRTDGMQSGADRYLLCSLMAQGSHNRNDVAVNLPK